MLRSVCIFSHYYDLPVIPYYVRIYVKELSGFFDEILLVTNHRSLKADISLPSNVKFLEVQNEGYDLGMFYKGFNSIDKNQYHTVACINDSNILFGSLQFLFDWAQSSSHDFWGLIDADIKPSYSSHRSNFHIQSHFMVFNTKAIACLIQYFNTIDIKSILKIIDKKQLKQRVINDWEIGLSQYLISNGIEPAAFVHYKEFTAKYHVPSDTNITLKLYQQLINSGIPMIKKKIITAIHPRIVFASPHWKDLIKKYAEDNIDTEKLIKELILIRNHHYWKRMWKK